MGAETSEIESDRFEDRLEASAPTVVRRPWILPFLAAAMVLFVNALHVTTFTQLSPFDELMHVDSLIKSARPGLVRMSQTFDQESMAESACRGHPVDTLPPCGVTPYVPEQFSWQGRNLASTHTPYYYVLTGLAARPLRAATGSSSLVTWGRLLGSAWLLGGLATLAVGRRRVAGSDPAFYFAAVLVCVSPSVLHAATTVNPDVTAIFGGSIVLVSVLAWEERRRGAWWIALSALIAVSLDSSNLLGVLAACLYVGIRAVARRDEGWHRAVLSPIIAAVAGGGGSLLAITAGRLLVSRLGTVDYSGNHQQVLFEVSRITAGEFFGPRTILALAPPTKGYSPPVLQSTVYQLAVTVAVATLVFSLIAVAVSGRNSRAGALATASLLTMVVGGPLLVAVNFFGSSWYFDIPSRYGLSIVPMSVLALRGLRHRVLVAGVGVVSAGLVVLTAVTLI